MTSGEERREHERHAAPPRGRRAREEKHRRGGERRGGTRASARAALGRQQQARPLSALGRADLEKQRAARARAARLPACRADGSSRTARRLAQARSASCARAGAGRGAAAAAGALLGMAEGGPASRWAHAPARRWSSFSAAPVRAARAPPRSRRAHVGAAGLQLAGGASIELSEREASITVARKDSPPLRSRLGKVAPKLPWLDLVSVRPPARGYQSLVDQMAACYELGGSWYSDRPHEISCARPAEHTRRRILVCRARVQSVHSPGEPSACE